MLSARVEKTCVREVQEDGSWYCSMLPWRSFSVLPLSSLSMNLLTGCRSGSGPATRRMMVYPSPNLEATAAISSAGGDNR